MNMNIGGRVQKIGSSYPFSFDSVGELGGSSYLRRVQSKVVRMRRALAGRPETYLKQGTDGNFSRFLRCR